MANTPKLATDTVSFLWDVDVSAQPHWKAALIRVSRIAYVVVRDIFQGRLTLHAMSLVYTTLLSIVPLLAIGFSVLKGFGVHNEIEPMLAQFLSPLGPRGAEITDKVIEFVDKTQVGVLGFVGLALLIYTVITLTQKIEEAFNDTWRISQPRTLARRFSDYLSVILVGPVLVFTAVGLQASFARHSLVRDLYSIQPVGWALEFLSSLMPSALVVIAFTFVFIFVPNTKVRFKPALVGGLISGLLWVTAGWAFASFVVSSARYTAIYSAFATVIFAMIWLYVSWLIVLVGGCIAFYVQHPEYLTPKAGPIHLSHRVRERIALQITSQIARTFYGNGQPWTLETLVRRMRAPREAVERVLLSLENNGLLVQTADDPPHFIPACPPDETEVKAILDAVRFHGEQGMFSLDRVPAAPAVKQVMEDAETAVAEALHGLTLKELALGETAPREPAAELAARPNRLRVGGGDT